MVSTLATNVEDDAFKRERTFPGILAFPLLDTVPATHDLKEESLSWAHGFRGFSPWLGGSQAETQKWYGRCAWQEKAAQPMETRKRRESRSHNESYVLYSHVLSDPPPAVGPCLLGTHSTRSSLVN